MEQTGVDFIDDTFRSFTFGQLQDFITLFKHITTLGLTPSDIDEYVELKNKQKLEAGKQTKKCPECGTGMGLHPGDSNDCFWACRACRYSEYSSRSVAEELKYHYGDQYHGKTQYNLSG